MLRGEDGKEVDDDDDDDAGVRRIGRLDDLLTDIFDGGKESAGDVWMCGWG